MPAIIDEISKRINDDVLRQISDQIGADKVHTQKGIAAALPLLIGGLARNANRSQPDAEALTSVLERDHDGSLLDNLSTILHLATAGSPVADASSAVPGGVSIDRRAVDGDAILGHVLGTKRDPVQLGVSRASGLDVRQVNRLLAILAPVVMSALGKVKRERNLNPDSVATLLNKERAEIEREARGVQGGGLLDFLDEENDGQIADNVAGMGARLAGEHVISKLFGVGR